jgi:tetratricopeptide (TPR) repeat protein
LDIVADVAGLDEVVALGAVDDALAAQLIRPGSQSEWFDFTHALFRHTLYAELTPPRQVRLHRQIAEAMERIWLRVTEHVAEIAYHYSRSAVLPGVERGVAFAIAAADRAEATYDHDEVATFVRIALELAPDSDPRRPRLLGRLGLAYTLTLKFAEALKAAAAAADAIASSEGEAAAADYLAAASTTMRQAGYEDGAGLLASQGLRYVHNRKDATWASLTMMDIVREEAQDPDYPGMSLDSPRWHELFKILENVPPEQHLTAFWGAGWWPFPSRDELLGSTSRHSPTMLSFFAGHYRQAVPLWEDLATRAEREGRIVAVLLGWAQAARCHTALGNFEAARAAYRKGRDAGSRLSIISTQVIQLVTARDDMWLALGEGWDPTAATAALGGQSFAFKYNAAGYRAATARVYAHLGMAQEAADLLRTLVRPLELAPGWMPNFTRMACDAASAVWLLNHVEGIEIIERNLRQKVVAPDFRYPMQDGRLSLARLCALRGRYDEAADWFGKSRAVLEQQGARPLRAIADLDEAIMYVRRNEDGDRHRAAPLLSVATMQFRTLGMTGWLRRAESLAP